MKAWRNLGNKQVMKKNKGRKEGYMVGWKKGRDESLKKRCKKSFDVGFLLVFMNEGEYLNGLESARLTESGFHEADINCYS